MRTVIGVDSGGTSTRAVLADESGRVLGGGRSGTGNPTSSGAAVALASMTEATLSAWRAAGSPACELVVVCGAGVTDPSFGTLLTAALDQGGLPIEARIVGDILGAYFSATAEPDGYVIVAGTGTTAGRIRDGAIMDVADGLGWLLGDGGSGFWLGRQVARAVAADLGGFGPSTALTPLVLQRLPPSPDAIPPWRPEGLHRLLRWTYSIRPVELSTFAPLAFAVAGDEVADEIVRRAAALIVQRLEAVVQDDAGPIVLTGGVLGPGPIADAVFDRWPGRCLRATDGTAGAALLALREVGLPAGRAELDRLLATSGSIGIGS